MKEIDQLELLGATTAEIDTAEEIATVDSGAIETSDLLKAVSGISGLTTATAEKALNLLGSGISSEQTASALGVTPSRVSQLLADEAFSDKVASMRYKNLQKHNRRDNAYDTLEDKLIGKLERAMPLLIKPESILKAMQIVNGAKRRGQPATQATNTQQLVVTLSLPTIIAQKFSVDMNNQVVSAGEQSLLTMPSGNLLDRVEAEAQKREIPHVQD